MRMRGNLFAVTLPLTGCAAKPFGLEPEADSVFGILMILLFSGLLYHAAKEQNRKRPESPAIHILRERYV